MIRRPSPRLLAALLALAPLLAVSAAEPSPETQAPPAGTPAVQQPGDVSLVISQGRGAKVPVAVPPAIAPITPELQAQVADPFHATLSDDLAGSSVFVVTDPALYPKGARPPATREQGDAWIAGSAQFLLDTQLEPRGDQIVLSARLWDLKTLKAIFDRRYQGESRAARRMAHVLANDLVRQFTGKPGPFLTKIAFVSDRDNQGAKELYLMDFDGQGQRRVTYHKSLSLAPDWSPDGGKIVYQSYWKGAPGLFYVSKDGGEKHPINVPTQLNASPSFSPDGRTIAYCGSVRGNPEIFTVNVDGSGLKRLTDSAAIDSTPRWTPNGRELAFTSNRQGSPQLYMMDLEGANVRRVTFAGNWNDEASFAPDGGRLAYACRNEGDMQICVQDLASGRVFQVSSGAGAHENPTWSPDGSKLAWEVSRGSSTQIMIANADGTGAKIVTSAGNNYSPSWSKTLE